MGMTDTRARVLALLWDGHSDHSAAKFADCHHATVIAIRMEQTAMWEVGRRLHALAGELGDMGARGTEDRLDAIAEEIRKSTLDPYERTA
jgi:hypothetical protein